MDSRATSEPKRRQSSEVPNPAPNAAQDIPSVALDFDVEAALRSCLGHAECWLTLIEQLDFSSEALMLAEFSLPTAWQPPQLTLSCQQDNEVWITPGRRRAIEQTLSDSLQQACQVVIEKKADVTTPYQLKLAREQARMAKATQDFLQHPQVKQAVGLLKATVDMDSIEILDESKESL